MAFNIMDLFSPGAVNRLLQPAQNTQGLQNFLVNPQAAQFDAGRFAGNSRLPAVGREALIERLSGPVSANGTAQAGAGAGQAAQGVGLGQGMAAVDPWAGMREQDVVRPDPMTTAGTTPQQPASAPGMMDRLKGLVDKETLNDIFLGWAMGETPMQSLSLGAAQASKGKSGRQNLNQTVEWLKGKGMDEGQARMLAGSPPALNEYLKTMAAGNDPMKALQLEKTGLEIENLRNPQVKPSESERAYEQAKADGFTGSRMEYDIAMKEAGRNKIDINTGVKLPSGYEWLDPNDQSRGVKPIAGGPAEQIPGELAARIGMAENFLSKDLPEIRSAVKAGNVTGLFDRFQAANNSGSVQARTYQKIQSGVEVLSRLLSGAGMTKDEIAEKTARYLPTYTDDANSVAAKMDQLEAELNATKDMAMRGRGGSQPPPQGAGGVVDYSEYFRGQ